MGKAGVAMAVLRHILQAMAGIVVTLGYLDEGTATEVVGVLMSVGSLVWFLYERRKNERSRNVGNFGPGGHSIGGGGGHAGDTGGVADYRNEDQAHRPAHRAPATREDRP